MFSHNSETSHYFSKAHLGLVSCDLSQVINVQALVTTNSKLNWKTHI